jgi:transposase
LSKIGLKETAVGSAIGCTTRAVRKWCEAFEENGDVDDDYRSGRKRILNERKLEKIEEKATNDPKHSTPKEIKSSLHLQCSAKTIRRVLNDELGLFGRIARVSPPLHAQHIQMRVSFANGYSKLDWTKVLWSDEMSIHLGTQGQTWVQRPIGEALNSCYVVEREKHPPKVHVWGCMSSAGVGECYVFTDHLDKELMVEILKTCLLKSAREFWKNESWWFQQDNDPKHSSRLVQDWLHCHGINCIEWPPYSPDLNPIENLWANLKKRVEQLHPTTTQQLSTAVKTAWLQTQQTYCAKLVASMSHRCQLCIEYEGGLTGY